MCTILGIYVLKNRRTDTENVQGVANSFSTAKATAHHSIHYKLIRECENCTFFYPALAPFPLCNFASENVVVIFFALLFIQQQIFRCSKWRDPTRSVHNISRQNVLQKEWNIKATTPTAPTERKKRNKYQILFSNGEWKKIIMLKMVDSTHTDTCIVYKIPNESKGMVQLGSAWLGSAHSNT